MQVGLYRPDLMYIAHEGHCGKHYHYRRGGKIHDSADQPRALWRPAIRNGNVVNVASMRNARRNARISCSRAAAAVPAAGRHLRAY